jgi:hypothetical protein
MDKQKIALWGVGVFGSLGLLILVIHLLSKTNRLLEQPVVKMPIPEGIIVNAQNQAIDHGMESYLETQSGKVGKSSAAHGDRSPMAKPLVPRITSAAIPPVTISAPISSTGSGSSVTIGSKRGTQDIASSTEFSILSANHQVMERFQASQKFRFSAQPNGIQIGEKIYADPVILQPKDNGLLFLEGIWYRGTFTVMRTADLLLVVNHTLP